MLPFISICTPTYNRRPFIPTLIHCIQQQDYPQNKFEWVIIDDGTDKIEDLVIHLPFVRYFKYEKRMLLGKKRNLMHKKTKGDIIVYMDDDDYYPPERISHAVEMLQNNPIALCAGSSEMYIYYKSRKQMYQCGPYGPNHATAASFAFRRELLQITKYNDEDIIAEETFFLQNYTIPFVQLNPLKSILVFSHIHNSFDKKELLQNPNQFMKLSDKSVDDFIKEEAIKKFFLNDIDDLLTKYEPGNPENKPDVLKQIKELKENRDKKMLEIQRQQQQQQQNIYIQQLITENNSLKEKVKYLENTITKIIQEKIENAKKN
jgi:glycosyltransferase involved in cell wall biosynthesis